MQKLAKGSNGGRETMMKVAITEGLKKVRYSYSFEKRYFNLARQYASPQILCPSFRTMLSLPIFIEPSFL